MGSLLAWLHLPCPGEPAAHDNLWSEENMPFPVRDRLRNHFMALGTLEPQFLAERGPWGHELTDSVLGEPKQLP